MGRKTTLRNAAQRGLNAILKHKENSVKIAHEIRVTAGVACYFITA